MKLYFMNHNRHYVFYVVHHLTLLHIDIDMKAALRVVQCTVYRTVYSVRDDSIYTSLETVEQNWRKPIYSVLSYCLIQNGFRDALQGLLNSPGDKSPIDRLPKGGRETGGLCCCTQ